MSRKTYGILGLALVFLAFGFLTGCSSSSSTPPPTIAITATGGATQTQTITEAFPTALGVNVTSSGSPATGVTVTFAPPSSGATCTPSATTATTDSSGNASITCTASSTAGAYSVTATATGAATPASFSLTNAPPSIFVYYLNGQEAPNTGNGGLLSYYAIAGTVAFDLSGVAFPDANGNCGEQDYNDGAGITSNRGTAPDTITATGSSMVVNQTTGTAILTLVSSNTEVGVAGTETFALQFMNASHALISQFDGSATSSGSMDLQSAQSGASGNFAFTLSGVDASYLPVGYGGVYTSGTGAFGGTVDVNDAGVATFATANNMTGTDNGTGIDTYGRGTGSVTINTTTLSLAYYIVGTEVVRIIDVDTGDEAVGSAYGQGATPAFDSTSLGAAAVFGILDNPADAYYAAAGNILPVGAVAGTPGATFTGEGDVNEGGAITAAGSATSGSYTIASNGYGSMSSITGLGDVTTLGLYATDPTLNLLDPNNTTGVVGSALVLDMDNGYFQATGIVVPQGTIASDGSDLNNSYGFGAQNYYAFGSTPAELDWVGQGSFASLVLTAAAGDISDPFGGLTGTAAEYTAVPFTGTAATPDTAGRYTYSTAFTFGPVVTAGSTFATTTVMYEASGSLVFSIDEDATNLFLGTFQEQSASSLKAMHVKHGALPKAQAKRKR